MNLTLFLLCVILCVACVAAAFVSRTPSGIDAGALFLRLMGGSGGVVWLPAQVRVSEWLDPSNEDCDGHPAMVEAMRGVSRAERSQRLRQSPWAGEMSRSLEAHGDVLRTAFGPSFSLTDAAMDRDAEVRQALDRSRVRVAWVGQRKDRFHPGAVDWVTDVGVHHLPPEFEPLWRMLHQVTSSDRAAPWLLLAVDELMVRAYVWWVKWLLHTLGDQLDEVSDEVSPLLLVTTGWGVIPVLEVMADRADLRDRVRGVIAIGAPIGGWPGRPGPLGEASRRDWNDACFRDDVLDVEVVRDIGYFSVGVWDDAPGAPGCDGLPLKAQRFEAPQVRGRAPRVIEAVHMGTVTEMADTKRLWPAAVLTALTWLRSRER
ncbi:MAG: hypothetical protein ACON5B_11425 [Myxococcota bacterium]